MIASFVVCLAMLAATFEVQAQEAAPAVILPPPAKSNLQPVHVPDLTNLEANDRVQLTSMVPQRSLLQQVLHPM